MHRRLLLLCRARPAALALLAVTTVATAGPLWQAFRDSAGNPVNDFRQWAGVQCGGSAGTCPCTSTGYGPGSCSTSSTNDPWTNGPSGLSARFALVDPAGNQNNGVFRVFLASNDNWNGTERNEFVRAKEPNSSGNLVAKSYGEGETRWFYWRTMLTSSTYTCAGSNCSNPWNTLTQWHSEHVCSGGGEDGIGWGVYLGRLPNTNAYYLFFGWTPGPVCPASPDPSQEPETKMWVDGDNPSTPTVERAQVQANVWYHFKLGVHFSSALNGGWIELYTSKGSDAPARVTLRCPDGAISTRCNVRTLDAGYGEHMKQGHYRNPSITDTTTLFHADTQVGLTANDVGPSSGPHLFYDDFSRTTGLGSNWTVAPGSFTTDGTQALSGTPPVNGNWAKVVPSLGTDDYSVQADILIPPGSTYSGVFARSSDPAYPDRTLYAAQFASDGTVNLYRRNNWTWTLLDSVPTGASPYVRHTLKLVARGSNPVQLEIWLDGHWYSAYNDNVAAKVLTGAPGMQNYDGSVSYKNFTVAP